jgi:hypothetical protein
MPNLKELVLIDPVSESIHATYESGVQACESLGIPYNSGLSQCVTHINNQYHGYIIKLKDEASPENIKKWSQSYSKGINGEVRCPKCRNWFKELPNSHCKECKSKVYMEYISTPTGFFKTMATRMARNAAEREAKGREAAGECTIDSDALIKMFNDQKGLCAYSGLPMITKPLSDWQASPERLNNDLGYPESNTVLVCLEFNTGHTQWSWDKVKQLRELRNKPVDLDALTTQVANAKGKWSKSPLRQFAAQLFQSARSHSRNIAKNPKRSEENSEFTLTVDDILQKIIDQKGRCAYSSIPLAYKLKAGYRMSIERINNKLGYTKENTVLICIDFNSTDQSSISDNAIGSSQWSKAKFEYLLANMNV